MKIHKYILDHRKIGVMQTVKIPRHGQLLHTDFFNDQLCMWYCVTDGDELISYPFIVNYTGDELPIDSDYIATVIDHQRKIVYHISIL